MKQIKEIAISQGSGAEFSQKDLRRNQLVAIFNKYLKTLASELYQKTEPLAGGREKLLSEYSSLFADVIRERLGIELIFHSSDGLQPYGYSVIDHDKQNVFKGGEIMDIKVLLINHLSDVNDLDFPMEVSAGLADGRALNSETAPANFLLNDNFIDQNESNLPDQTYQYDQGLNENADSVIYSVPVNSESNSGFQGPDNYLDFTPDVTVDIADDIDDEAILGRNRRRQKKARTNTR